MTEHEAERREEVKGTDAGTREAREIIKDPPVTNAAEVIKDPPVVNVVNQPEGDEEAR